MDQLYPDIWHLKFQSCFSRVVIDLLPHVEHTGFFIVFSKAKRPKVYSQPNSKSVGFSKAKLKSQVNRGN